MRVPEEKGSAPTAGGPSSPRRRVPLWGRVAAIAAATLFLLALVLTGSLARLFAKGNPTLSRQILFAINRSIGTDSTWIECDGIHGLVLGGAVLENPRLMVRTIDGPATWMSARRLEAKYELFELLFSRRRSVLIGIDAPVLRLFHDRRGNFIVPRFGASKRGGPARSATRIGVEIRDGTLSLDRGGIRFGGIHGSAVAFLQRDSTTLRVTKLTGRSGMPGRPGSLRVDGLAIIAGGRMKFRPLHVALDRTNVNSTIDWNLSRGRVESSTIVLAPLDLAEAMRILDIIPVTEGTLTGRISFVGDPTSGSASAKLEGEIAGEPLDTLVARAEFVPGAVRLEDVRARVRQTEVVGRGVFETRGDMSAEAAFTNVDPARLPWWKLPAMTPHGRLSGRAKVSARKTRPNPSADISLDLDRGRFGRLAIDRAVARIRLDGRGDANLDTVWVESPGATLRLSGSLSADTTMSLTLAGDIRDLGAMDSLLAPVRADAGTGRFAGTLTGKTSRPLYQAHADLFAGRLTNGVGFDSITVNSRGRLGESGLGSAVLRVVGLRAGSRALGTLDASLSVSDRIVIESYRETLGDTTLTLAGEIRFRGKTAAAVLDSVAMRMGPIHWRSVGPVNAALEGERLHISRLKLAMDSGELEIVGSVWPGEGRLDARGLLRGIDLARAMGWSESAAVIGGVAEGEFIVVGPFEDPEVQAKLEVLNPRVQHVSGDSLSVDLSYAPGFLRVEKARWASRSGMISLGGSIHSRLTLGKWLQSVARRTPEWGSQVEVALEGKVDSLDLATFAPTDTSIRSLAGITTLRLRATGTLASPVLSLEGSTAGLSYQGVAVENVQYVASYEGRRLRLTRLDLRQGNASTHVEGQLPVDLSLYAPHRWLRAEPITLHVRMIDADFSVAALFFPSYIASSAGRLNLMADAEGTAGAPEVKGTVKLNQGVVRITGRDEVLDQVELDGTFDARRLNVTRFAAREGKRGALTGSGYWQWVDGRHLGDYEFRLHLSDFTATDRETYLIRASGDLLVQDGKRPDGKEVPRVTSIAPVALSRGELTMDLARPQTEVREPLPFLYDIAVDIPRNLWYRNVDCETELDGRITLRNEGERDLILGSLNVRGKYYFYSNEFRVLKGEISFTTLDRVDPTMLIEAETTVQGIGGEKKIYLTLSGPSSKLKVHLHDDEGASENYLWKALTFGQFTTLSETQAVGPSAAGPDATLPVTNYVFRNAERLIADVGFIDTIDLKSGRASTTTTGTGSTPLVGHLGLGKYVTPELYLKYSRDFSGSAEQKIIAEYRVTRYLLLHGEQVHRSTKDRPGELYNLDLKVRLEY